MTEKEIIKFAHPDYIEKVRESLIKTKELQQKDPSKSYMVDCYGEIRGLDKKNLYTPKPEALEGSSGSRQKLFSEPDKKEYWGFKDGDEYDKKLFKSSEKFLNEKRKNGEDI